MKIEIDAFLPPIFDRTTFGQQVIHREGDELLEELPEGYVMPLDDAVEDMGRGIIHWRTTTVTQT